MATIVTRAGKGSALTWTEGDANFTNLNNDKIEAVSDDLTPSLGGDLDVAGNSIVSSANGDVTIAPNGTGIVILQSDLEVGYGNQAAAITSNGNYALDLVTNSGTNSGMITINPGLNADIEISPNGTGNVVISGLSYPTADGTADQVLKTDGAGNLSFATVSGGITDIVEDTTPQLGGNLDVNGNIITSTTNGNIELQPNGTGDVLLTADTVRVGDLNSAATITTNGTGNLVLNTNSGTNSGSITVTQGANANITVAPNGTGMTMLNNIEYHEKIHSLGTTSGTITPDVANGNVQTITLNGNLTFSAFSNPIAGQSLTLIINTNGTGRTLTSTMLFAGGSKTLSTTSTIDIISVFYNGTTYYASLAKDFK